jgi:cobaltochelatase CobT
VTAPPERSHGQFQHQAAAVLHALSRRRQPPDAALLRAAPLGADPQQLALWRGRLDATALRLRYSDAQLLARESPMDASQQALFERFEQARVEALGVGVMRGVRANLIALQASLGRRHEPQPLALLAARFRWGAPLPAETEQALRHDWRVGLSPPVAQHIEAMAGLLGDQAGFAARARALLELLGPQPDLAAMAEPGPEPQADRQRSHRAESAAAAATAPLASSANDERAAEPLSQVNILRRVREEPRGQVVPQASSGAGMPPYHVYTSQFDAVLAAPEIVSVERLAQLARQLEAQQQGFKQNVSRWAHRLQRHLLARQMRAWQFDLEEGVLDCARLTRVVTDPAQPLSFKQELEADFPLTAVSVLVDNSGSMRGTPIAIAATCAVMLGAVLERCGIPSEILGYTTRRWRGGRARALWVKNGRSSNPGRVTDLLHIVYKRAEAPWRRSRRALAVMLEEDLLKENVDGEALLWAHERLLRRFEQRRILMVVCDGAPLDDATLAANDPGYLERHLRSVIRHIETRSPVELLSIGIGQDVGAFYANAFTVSGPEDLGEAMVKRLIESLNPGRRRGAGRSQNAGKRRLLRRKQN